MDEDDAERRPTKLLFDNLVGFFFLRYRLNPLVLPTSVRCCSRSLHIGQRVLTMRSTYIVCYDIADDKRLRKVFKTMKAFGDHIQYSVFECQLSPRDLIQCRQRLSEIINNAQDQVLFIDLGPSEGRGERVIAALGQAYQPFDAACMIV